MGMEAEGIAISIQPRRVCGEYVFDAYTPYSGRVSFVNTFAMKNVPSEQIVDGGTGRTAYCRRARSEFIFFLLVSPGGLYLLLDVTLRVVP